jgi:glutamate-1-semialdehyde 2,1-aminomutase
LLERFAPAGDVYQAGTLSGNPVAVAAGLATLGQLDDAAYRRISELTARLVNGLETVAGRHGLQVASVPGLATLFFRDRPVPDFEAALATDAEAHAAFCRGMLQRGIYLPPSRFEAWFVSLAHDEASIDLTLEATGATLDELQRAGGGTVS